MILMNKTTVGSVLWNRKMALFVMRFRATVFESWKGIKVGAKSLASGRTTGVLLLAGADFLLTAMQ